MGYTDRRPHRPANLSFYAEKCLQALATRALGDRISRHWHNLEPLPYLGQQLAYIRDDPNLAYV